MITQNEDMQNKAMAMHTLSQTLREVFVLTLMAKLQKVPVGSKLHTEATDCSRPRLEMLIQENLGLHSQDAAKAIVAATGEDMSNAEESVAKTKVAVRNLMPSLLDWLYGETK